MRDPLKRAISHYLHQYIDRKEFRNVDEAFYKLENNHYINCSLYSFQLEQFLKYFDLSNVLIVKSEDLLQNTRLVLNKIFSFLNVDANFDHPDFSAKLHKSSEKKRLTQLGSLLFKIPIGGRMASLLPSISFEKIEPPLLSEPLREQVKEFLAQDVERLRLLTGISWKSWDD